MASVAFVAFWLSLRTDVPLLGKRRSGDGMIRNPTHLVSEYFAWSCAPPGFPSWVFRCARAGGRRKQQGKEKGEEEEKNGSGCGIR